MRKKILQVVFVMSVMLGLTVTAHAGSGMCGEDVTWNYDSSTNTLTISGSGDMYDYSSDLPPWEDDVGNTNNVKTVRFEMGVTSVGEYAFAGYRGLTTVDLGYVKKIGAGAFRACRSLENIEMPSTIESIGRYAFWRCDSLTSMKIPANTTYIGDSAFVQCRGLQAFEVDHFNSSFTGVDGVIYDKDMKELVAYPTGRDIQNYAIRSGTESARYGAFNGAAIDTLTIPSSLTDANGAFIGCECLKYEVEDGNSDYTASGGVLFNADMTELVAYPGAAPGAYEIPSSVTKIGDDAFCGSDGLTQVTIPGNVKEIGYEAFFESVSLSSVRILDGVEKIGDYAFDLCESLRTVEIAGSVEEIGDYAFDQCTSLENLSLKNGLKTIWDGAFYGCRRLESVELPKSLEYIGDDAFGDCSLHELTIPLSLTYIGSGAFSGCPLDNVYYQGTRGEFEDLTYYSGIDDYDPLVHCVEMSAENVGGNFVVTLTYDEPLDKSNYVLYAAQYEYDENNDCGRLKALNIGTAADTEGGITITVPYPETNNDDYRVMLWNGNMKPINMEY